MAKKTQKRKKTPSPSRRRHRRYSTAELFMAGVGILLIIMFIGIVVSAVLD